MILNISGHQVILGDGFQERIKAKLESKIKKHFKDVISVHVNFDKKGPFFFAEITINDGIKKQNLIRGDGKEKDAYSALDEAIHKIEAQLRKLKERLQNHPKHHRKEGGDDDVSEE